MTMVRIRCTILQARRLEPARRGVEAEAGELSLSSRGGMFRLAGIVGPTT